MVVPVFLSYAGLSTPGAMGIISTQGLSSQSLTFPHSVLFSLFKKITKINLKLKKIKVGPAEWRDG